MTRFTDEHLATPDGAPDAARRGLLLAGVGLLLTGCAQPQRAELPLLPGPFDTPKKPVEETQAVTTPPRAETARVTPTPEILKPTPLPGVLSRRTWATGRPVPGLMNRMTPVRYVTVHHDGMRPFFADDRRSAAARLDAIRRAHRGRNWGDIGYHYAVDRAGTIWECRPLNYQGAHVKNFNPGNIGIVALGNFDEQHPTQAQLTGLQRHISALLRGYRIPARNLRTHQQWAPTRCPGRHMQSFVVNGLRRGAFG